MALVLNNGAIFLHIPKTGGSWVTEVLKDQGLIKYPIGHIHADLHQVLRNLKPKATIKQEIIKQINPRLPLAIKKLLTPKKRKLEKQAIWNGSLIEEDTTPFIFCFVRHPLTWYESVWRYMLKHNWPMFGRQYDVHHWHPLSMLNGLGDPDFNIFISNIISKRPGFVTELLGWYTLPGINYIGKQETLKTDLIRVLNMMGVNYDINKINNFGRINVSPNHVAIEWDARIRDQLLCLERASLIKYKYNNKFSEPCQNDQ